MKKLLLAVVFVLLSCNQVANSSPALMEKPSDSPMLLRVYDEKYGVMCYFPLKYGREVPVLEGMSCVQLVK